MTALATAATRSHKPLPRSRSRGGWGAGSADQPGRRNPPAASPSANVPTAEFIAAARSALTAQRTFRLHQLEQLDAASPDPATDPARVEIHRALREAARSVLHDTEAALRRIQRGTYTRCPRCGGAISIERLRALPMAARCGRCQRATAKRLGADEAE
jgi:DnaK suppressor protein